MYTTTGGYCYQGAVKARKSLHINRMRAVRMLVFLVLFASSFLFGALVHAYATDEEDAIVHPNAAPIEPAYLSHSVEQGETLWSIAKVHMPERTDIRAFIQDIKEMNDLQSSMLQEGQLLQIPTVR